MVLSPARPGPATWPGAGADHMAADPGGLGTLLKAWRRPCRSQRRPPDSSAQRRVAAPSPVCHELLHLQVGGPHIGAQLVDIGDGSGVLISRQLLEYRRRLRLLARRPAPYAAMLGQHPPGQSDDRVSTYGRSSGRGGRPTIARAALLDLQHQRAVPLRLAVAAPTVPDVGSGDTQRRR